MPRNAQAEAYTDHLRKRMDHTPGRQEVLQRRVYQTFNRLTFMYTGRRLGPRVLELGGIGTAFISACLDLGCQDAKSVGVEYGVDFERDSFPFMKGEFDTVCANSLIEHLHNPAKMLSETYRAMHPGGLFILVTPHWPYCARTFFDAYTHVQPYTAASLRAALETHGFEVLATVPWMVGKADFFWRLPAPWSYRLAAELPFDGLDARPWIPSFLKGRSRSLLALARKPK